MEKGIYRHFKGKYYEVLDIATHTETGETMVVYRPLYEKDKLYIRPIDMFLSDVDKIKYPQVRQTERFYYIQRDLLSQILVMEKQITMLFSVSDFVKGVECFTDNKLLDKYYHNYYSMEADDTFLHEKISHFIHLNDMKNVSFRIEGKGSLKNQENSATFVDHNAYLFNKIDDILLDDKVQECIVEDVTRLNAEDFSNIFYEIYENYGSDFSLRNIKRELDIILTTKNYGALIIKQTGVVLGMLIYFYEDKLGTIVDFYVKKASRHRGLGSALIDALIKKFKLNHVENIYLVADQLDTPYQMYQKMNFHYIGEYTFLTFLKEEK